MSDDELEGNEGNEGDTVAKGEGKKTRRVKIVKKVVRKKKTDTAGKKKHTKTRNNYCVLNLFAVLFYSGQKRVFF